MASCAKNKRLYFDTYTKVSASISREKKYLRYRFRYFCVKVSAIAIAILQKYCRHIAIDTDINKPDFAVTPDEMRRKLSTNFHVSLYALSLHHVTLP